jgi:DUF438 domain-containing protein
VENVEVREVDDMDEGVGKIDEGKKKGIKDMIRRLHEGEDPDEVKKEFEEVLKDTSPTEIARIEDELVREGLPRERLHKLCDVHLAMFKDQLDGQKVIAPEGHPVHTLMEEHKILLRFAEMLRQDAEKVSRARGFEEVRDAVDHIRHIADHFKESEKHYLREENVLFPYLDKHGIKEPPAVMWMEHDKIREIKKGLYGLFDERRDWQFEAYQRRLRQISIDLSEMLSNHFFKENNILFPAALNVITDGEWKAIGREFDDVGYCCFTPSSAQKAAKEGQEVVKEGQEAVREGEAAAACGHTGEAEGTVDLGTGSMTREELEWVLRTMPVDVTFVDKDDRVRYFSMTKDRIFVRTKAVIGRKVQMCHPQKSVHVVEKILSDFRQGKRDMAEFWLDLQGRLVHIRYFAVRNDKGEYLGCLEVSQDLTPLQQIKGQKRLLDG